MGISGLVGAGTAQGLEELLARQLLEAQQAEAQRRSRAQEALQSEQLGLQRQQFDAQQQRLGMLDEQAAIEDLRGQQDKQRARLTELQGEEDQRSAQEALQAEIAAIMGDESMPSTAKRALRLKRVGVSAQPNDLMAQDEVDAQRQGKVQDAIAIARGQQQAERDFTPEPQSKPAPGGAMTNAGAVETAADVQRLARALKQHPSRSRAFGVTDERLPTLRQGTRDAEVLRDSLQALLTLENTDKMKGVLSDADIKLLRQAGSTLSAGVSDEAAIAELERLDAAMQRVIDAGGAPGALAPMPSHGGGAAPAKKFTILGVK